MSIYLHAYTSLPVLFETEGTLLRVSKRSVVDSECSAAAVRHAASRLSRLGISGSELHLIVDTKNKRNTTIGARIHVCGGALPRGTFMELGDGIYITSPEAVFLQMAKCLDFVDLVYLGYELCAEYRVDKAFDDVLRQSKPLTTMKRLSAFIQKSQGIAGYKQAKRALKYVRESARSPREIVLSMLLGLPTRLGGWQFGEHVLNHRVDVGFDIEGYTNRYIDLYWRGARVGLEYDSDAYHLGDKRIAHDSVREKVLSDFGITMMRITNSELTNPLKRELCFRLLARELGIRLRNDSPDIKRRRDALAAVLLSR